MRPQLPGIDRRTGAGNHIADEPPVAAAVLARNHRRLRHTRMAHQHRLDLAGLDAEAAQLHLRIDTPEKVQHPVGTPARQIAGAVHATPGRAERIRHEPLHRKPGTPEIAARQPRSGNVKLARNTRRYRLQASIQNIEARVPNRPANGDLTEVIAPTSPMRHIDGSFSRAVQVLKLSSRQQLRRLPQQLRGKRLTAADEAANPCALLHPLMRKKGLQHGRHKMQRRHTLLADDFNEPAWIAMRPWRSKYQTRASDERPKEFPNRDVKTKGRLLQDNIFSG